MKNDVVVEESVLTKPKEKTGFLKQKVMDTIFIVSILTLPIIHWLVSWLFVNIQSILMAFQLPTGEWSLLNFEIFFSTWADGTSDLILAVKNSLKWFSLSNFIIFPFTLTLNYFFFKKMPGYAIFRILLYIPGLISGVAIATMIKEMVMPNGFIGVLIQKVFKIAESDIPHFFDHKDYANTAMMLYSFWGSWGSNLLLFGGTFARVPRDVLEAAKLDGCTPGRELVQLIIPMISSTLVTMIILNLTGILSASGPLLLFTQGKYGTMTLSYWIFDSVRFGGAGTYNTVAATGLLVTCVVVPFILTCRWLLEKIPVVEY